MALTPEDVRNKQFTTVRLREGYDEGEVDAFLDEIEAEMGRLLEEIANLRAGNGEAHAHPVTVQDDQGDQQWDQQWDQQAVQQRDQPWMHEGAGTVPAQPPVPGAMPGTGHQPLGRDDPRQIGRYRLTARLGQGGMGTVYLGLSPGERMVAVKVVKVEFAADPEFRKRFGREIETSRRVGGFYTAPVVDADADGDPPWLATEYIPGVPLHEVLRQQGALPVRTVHVLAAGMAEALAAIHASGVIHRDLKPSNIIVTSTGPRVIDFGIARAFDGTALTRTGHIVGTPGFLAPEQLTGAAITPAADLYAFGMVLCHATGAAPFPDGEPLAVSLELLPARLAAIITRCLDPDPAKRPRPDEILQQLIPNRSSVDGWLPRPVRTMIHHLTTAVSAP